MEKTGSTYQDFPDTSAAPATDIVISSVAKTSWPELIGTTVARAIETIERERPDMIIVKATIEGSIVTTDMACRRVRVWHNADGIVSQVPRIG